MKIFRTFAAAAVAGFMALSAAKAQTLAEPLGPVILTVSGQIKVTNAGKTAAFSMEMLERLPQTTFTTKTPWYPEKVQFTGPLLRDVLAATGARGKKIVATALNDYKTDIPFTDATEHDIIIAHLMNGRPMPVRERGPLFIVYPYETKSVLMSEKYYVRSAWQLNKLDIQ